MDLLQSIESLIATLGEALEDIATVEVRTSTTGPSGSELRAITRAHIGGGASHCLPHQPDPAICKLHSAMVNRAVANRVEMVQLAAAAIGGPVPE